MQAFEFAAGSPKICRAREDSALGVSAMDDIRIQKVRTAIRAWIHRNSPFQPILFLSALQLLSLLTDPAHGRHEEALARYL